MLCGGRKRMKKLATNTVQLLWTGGWDSTFRLLDLLLLKRCTVLLCNQLPLMCHLRAKFEGCKGTEHTSLGASALGQGAVKELTRVVVYEVVSTIVPPP